MTLNQIVLDRCWYVRNVAPDRTVARIFLMQEGSDLSMEEFSDFLMQISINISCWLRPWSQCQSPKTHHRDLKFTIEFWGLKSLRFEKFKIECEVLEYSMQKSSRILNLWTNIKCFEINWARIKLNWTSCIISESQVVRMTTSKIFGIFFWWIFN